MDIFAAVPDGSRTWNHYGNYTADAIKGADYWVKFIFDGTRYTISLSSDGKIFKDIIQIDYGVMHQFPSNSHFQFGGVASSGNDYFEGSIDLKETYIKIGGQTWWGRG